MFSNLPTYFSGRNNRRGGHHYDPNQPRVPKGNSDGGQWTDGGAGLATEPSDDERGWLSKPWIRLASNEKRPGGGIGRLLLVFVQLFQSILDYRKANPPQDLFGTRDAGESTIAATTIDDKTIIGLNSKHPDYTLADRAAAMSIRTALARKYPDLLKPQNPGRMPGNALFHAEATALLRAANANRGTLRGQMLHVVTDRELCTNCKVALPLLGLELGDPIVIFMDPTGAVHEMRNGEIKKRPAP
jgi:hypothetical protein